MYGPWKPSPPAEPAPREADALLTRQARIALPTPLQWDFDGSTLQNGLYLDRTV